MKNMVALGLAIIAIRNEAEHELEKGHQPRHIKMTRRCALRVLAENGCQTRKGTDEKTHYSRP